MHGRRRADRGVDGRSICGAGDPRPRPAFRYAKWARCEGKELSDLLHQRTPEGPGNRLLETVPCASLEWMGDFMGGGPPDSLTTCTCFRYVPGSDALCDVTVCPGDGICREGYRFAGLKVVARQLVAVVEVPGAERNCWRPIKPIADKSSKK
jgi:hypothetical protein